MERGELRLVAARPLEQLHLRKVKERGGDGGEVVGGGAGGDGGGGRGGAGGGGTDLLIPLAELLVHCGGRWLLEPVASDRAGHGDAVVC